MSRTLVVVAALLGMGFLGSARAQELFDGKSLAGWKRIEGNPENWTVENGVIVTRGAGGGWLSTEAIYRDFEIELEYRLQPGGNSGLFVRAPHEGNPAFAGIEIQLLDDDAPEYKELEPFQYTGSVYGVVAAKRGHTKKPGEWNALRVRCEGPKIVVHLNSEPIVSANLEEHPDAAKEHPGILRREGYVGLQAQHGEGPVEFRNIRMKSVK
jgi:hypothetical protein